MARSESPKDLLHNRLKRLRRGWVALKATFDSSRVDGPDIYTHHKLDLSRQQIRILRLLPGERFQPIQCSLYTAYLSAHPPYEALSYAWGDATDREPIVVENYLCEVTANLARALRRLRKTDQERHLWVDAICINQADNNEKSHQVNLMKEVYTNAVEGLMWLGEFEENRPSIGFAQSAESIRNYGQLSITENSRVISGEHAASTTLNSTIISEADTIKALSLVRYLSSNEHLDHMVLSELKEGTQALSTFMNLAWWHRIWTVQEAILPRKITIICGGILVDWELLASASVNFINHWGRCCNPRTTRSEDDALRKFNERVDSINWYRNELEAMDILRTLFIFFQNRLATDPRDKVFGLLGLFPSEMQHLSEADYSLSKHQVYKRITFHRIKETGDLCSLIRVHERKRQRALPSWVPDLEAKIDESTLDLMMRWIWIYDLFDAASGTQLDLGNNIVNDLKLKGACVDEISEIMEWDSNVDTASVDRFKELVTSVASFEDEYPLGDTYESAFCRTLRRDYYHDPTGDEGREFKRLHQTEFKQIRDANDLGYHNESLFLTQSGLIGVGSPGCRVGDQVYVLYGGKIPFILRPARKRGRQNCYRYVGHAYVHGIMDGEALGPTVIPEYVTLI
ncbi:hypothetical protein G7054_g1984 [Neopestalotiopsis clavispora]|nr:hypothetical protein G7054_g1984 [Neopestalotiopsis clavispora]